MKFNRKTKNIILGCVSTVAAGVTLAVVASKKSAILFAVAGVAVGIGLVKAFNKGKSVIKSRKQLIEMKDAPLNGSN